MKSIGYPLFNVKASTTTGITVPRHLNHVNLINLISTHWTRHCFHISSLNNHLLFVLMLTKSLNTWNDYLANCTDKHLLPTKVSCYDDASNFFSAPGIIDFYGSNGNLWITDIQRFLNANTDSYINSLFSFSNSSRSYDLFHVDLFNSDTFFSTSDIENNCRDHF